MYQYSIFGAKKTLAERQVSRHATLALKSQRRKLKSVDICSANTRHSNYLPGR